MNHGKMIMIGIFPADTPTFRLVSASGVTGRGEVNCHFRLALARNFRTQPAAPVFKNCWHATNSVPREDKTLTH
jgi:hypothetical protein